MVSAIASRLRPRPISRTRNRKSHMTPARFEIGQKHKQESEAGSKASWNTPRSDSRPTMSYPSRMALAFALTSLMTVLVLVGVVSVVWGTVFSDYTRSNIVEIANSAAEKLATSYEENGSWTAGSCVRSRHRVWCPTIWVCRSSTRKALSFMTTHGLRQARPPMCARTNRRRAARAGKSIA